jgi:hypothetical protein
MTAENVHRHSRRVNPRNPRLLKGAVLLGVMLLPLILGAWRNMTGYTINPRYVQRIKDGQTTKQEIMLYFGDPQEINRSADGLVYIYKSFKDAPAMPYRPEDRKINPQSESLMVIDEDKQIKKAPLKTEGKILRSTLTVHFKPHGETVMSHEYKEYKDKE